MSQYYYFANPKIYFFPRGLNDLLDEEKKTADGIETVEKKCELKDILRTYEDDKNHAFGDRHFKNIESRIYLDLWNNHQDNEYTVTKKVCVGFLSKRDEQLRFVDKEAYFYSLELKCKISGSSQLTAYLKADDRDNSGNPDSPLVINMNPVENRIKELSVIIKYGDDAELPENAELKINAKFINAEKWKTFTLSLYRNPESSLDDFKQNPDKKDTDFFVLPRVAPSANQKKCIKQLQILNNQVFARNASLKNFNFVEESGEIIKSTGTAMTKIYETMASNAYNSLEAFKYDLKTGTGCKSGSKIGKIETQYSYNFINYGHQNGFIDYLSNEYSVDSDTLKGIIYDRNFLFGNYKDGDPDNKIEGIVNLYREVVVQFIEKLSEQIDLYNKFDHAWLSCPYYNKNYKRGPFTIADDASKYLYIGKTNNLYSLASLGWSDSQGNNKLPVGSVVNFKEGMDKDAFEKTGENYYEIESVTIQGTSYTVGNGIFIKLSLQDKQSCNDSVNPCNFGNYNGTEFDYGNYGIPYYIHSYKDMPRWRGIRTTKMDKYELLDWGKNEDKNNWYSYIRKPNTEDFGIDCSGFVVNAITGIENLKGHSLSTSNLDISAQSIGTEYCRKLPISENYGFNSYLTKNDIVYSKGHIAFCTDGTVDKNFDNKYVLKVHITSDRQFNICHNYGTEYIYIDSNENINSKSEKDFNLYALKNIRGYFRHWGINIEDKVITYSVANIGRIYLWN